MRTLRVVLFFILSLQFSHAQILSWSDDMPSDPHASLSSPIYSVMYNGKVFNFSYGMYAIQVDKYDPETGFWSKVNSSSDGYIYIVKIKQMNNIVHMVYYSSNGLFYYTYDLASNTATKVLLNNTTTINAIAFDVSSDQTQVAVLYQDNGDLWHGVYNTSTGTFTTTAQALNYLFSGVPWSIMNFSNYFSDNNYYISIAQAPSYFLLKAPANSPNTLSYSDNIDGKVKLNGTPLTRNFKMIGDGHAEPILLVTDYNNFVTYEKQVTPGAVINVNTSTDASTPFVLDSTKMAIANSVNSTCFFADYSIAGTSTQLGGNVFKRNFSTGVWTKVMSNEIASINSYYSVAVNNTSDHISVTYQNGSMNVNSVANVAPEIFTHITPTGTCNNHKNQIFEPITFKDELSRVRVTNINCLDPNISLLEGVFHSYSYNSPHGYTDYNVFAKLANGGNFDIVFTYTDGFSSISDTVFNVTLGLTSAPAISMPTTLNLCKNDNLIDLSQFVTNYQPGVFSVGNLVLPNSTLDGVYIPVAYPNANKIYYYANVNGCIIEDSSNLNFPALASATITKTNSVCGSNSGSASVSYTPGASIGYATTWSTGETTSTINNLSPGAYFYDIKDDYNCHVRGVANIGASGISIQPTITNVTCNGLSDGSISIQVNHPGNYYILWSTGQSTPTIANLKAGTYTVTVWDNSGCSVNGTYIVSQPAPIVASFSVLKPTCGNSNGGIYPSVVGGPYTYNWLGQGIVTQSIINKPAGIYKLRITDLNGCYKDYETIMDDKNASIISGVVTPTKCGLSNGAIAVNVSYNPLGGSLADSVLWSNGSRNQDINNLNTGNYTLTCYSNYNYYLCKSFKKFNVPVKSPDMQPICIVTVDTSTTTNLVVWEKTESVGVHHYNIYRETDYAGEYMLIDTVMASNEPIFNDVVASPKDRSWRYKISAENACGAEGSISIAHKTLHLNTIVNNINGSMDVYWDDYEGSPDVNGYLVWRFTNQSGWVQASPVIAPGTLTYNDVPPVGETGLDYMVTMELLNECTAEKAQDFNTTRSNRQNSNYQAGFGTGNSNNSIVEDYLNNIEVYPNPTANNLFIKQQENQVLSVRILDLSGAKVLSHVANQQIESIDVSQLRNGLYFVEMSIGDAKTGDRKSVV